MYPQVTLGKVLKRKILPAERISKSLSEQNVIAKITFGGVLHLRQEEEKREYKGPLFLAHSGDLVISKIRVAQGSFCIVPEDMDHLAVSPEYPVYEVDKTRISTCFVQLAIRTTEFQRRVLALRSGNTTKTRIRPHEFERLTLPVPDYEEQVRLCAKYKGELIETDALDFEADRLETEAMQAFESALGVTPPPPLPEQPVFIARFKEVERWSHEGILRSSVEHRSEKPSMWPLVAIGEIGKVSYGLQKCPQNRPGANSRPYLRVANVQRDILDLQELKYINVPDEDMPKYLLQPGDILLCEGNSADLVGRGAIWRGEIENCVHQNHILRVRIDPNDALPEFVLAVMNSSYGQQYFRAKAKRTTNLASINSREVAGLEIPLPPVDVQRALISQLDSVCQKAKRLRDEAGIKRKSAWEAFESALFE